MRKFLIIPAATLAGLLLFPAVNAYSNNTQTPVNIRKEKAEPLRKLKILEWWKSERLTVEGHGFVSDDKKNTLQGRMLAKRMAVMDGYRNLAEAAGKVQITSNGFLSKRKINALVRGVSVISETYDKNGNCTVTMSVPIYGVMDSFAKFAFSSVDREDFPAPTGNTEVEGKYTGLIIDCGDLEVTPILSPVIRDEKNLSVYGFSNLDYEKVVTKGMIGYAERDSVENNDLMILTSAKFQLTSVVNKKSTADDNLSRAGNNPLVIDAKKLSDDNTCPIISAEDADKILSENLSTHFLDEGAVVFVSNRIRGMRL